MSNEIEYNSRYTLRFKTLKEAKKVALAMAKKRNKPVYLACSSGSTILFEDKLFSSSYYVASPDGSFEWK